MSTATATMAGNAWLVAREPVHIGGADSDNRGNSNPIFRLPDRTPVLPGSSLRGALREHAETEPSYNDHVKNWFGGNPEESAPGRISLGWGWPVWWPVHVLGYGNWWVSCPTWLRRFGQLTGNPVSFLADPLLITDQELEGQTVYLRWVKLEGVTYQDPTNLPLPPELESYRQRLIVVPDHSITVLVDMGLVRQPRVSLKSIEEFDQENQEEPAKAEKNTLVKHLFAVEAIPPGAAFLLSWSTRKQVENVSDWKTFLHQEHHLGGLWSVGYGRVVVEGIEGA
jgi:CRISPR/Cas system CMR subunit Cmr4 (Cas7 group RAMP superfamily)